MLINVLVEIKALNEKTFTYSVPSYLISKVEIGKRVLVPFGKRNIYGLITGYVNNTEYDTKDIIDVIDDEIILSDELIKLGEFMSNKYICSLMSCYQCMLPNALKFNKKDVNIKYEIYIEKIGDLSNPSRGEINILDLFKESNIVRKKDIKNKNILNKLIEKGVLKEVKEEVYRFNKIIKENKLNTLTNEQNKAYESILQSKKNVILLRGVTGSGKTEIYMHLIKKCIDNGRNAMILVPEISLTTQLINRIMSVFKDTAILHSNLSDGEKYDEWRKIKNNKVSLVIGTRSAVFAPLSNIGLIIIDEEHEDTYKQDTIPRYRVIDIALERIKYNNAKILLGSATPSLESYSLAKVGRYELVELTKRVNNHLPLVKIIDMKDEIKKGNSILSSEAICLINDRLNKKEQIMILINRRGYSNYIICNECANVFKCPNCDISLTYYKSNKTLKCHYCGYAVNKIDKCPKCNSKYLLLKGIGTEKIEEYLNDLFNARVVRMDRDTTSNKGMHEKIINEFNDYKYDIMLGTQMISKGLDFKNVTLVIVLNGDSSLNIPDYRSAEKTFNLLTQVSGRAGRNKKEGIALIQTYNPEHYSIMYAKEHDYIGFYNKEIQIRKSLKYPPFSFIVAIRTLSSDINILEKETNKILNYLKNNLNNKYTILGPNLSLKINNIYKYQIIIKYKDKELIYDVLKNIEKNININKIKLEIDFSPIKL